MTTDPYPESLAAQLVEAQAGGHIVQLSDLNLMLTGSRPAKFSVPADIDEEEALQILALVIAHLRMVRGEGRSPVLLPDGRSAALFDLPPTEARMADGDR